MRTQDANNIHINEYLERIGAKRARIQNGTNGTEYVYHTPNREDKNPSLCVNLDRNIWSDVPAGEGGKLIALVCYLNNFPKEDVSSALKNLDNIFPEYRGTGHTSRPRTSPNYVVESILGASSNPNFTKKSPTSLKEKINPFEIKKIGEIYRYPLKNYIAERGIPLKLAMKYLKEIEYSDHQGRTFFTLGFKAGESYAHRNKVFKGFLGQGVDVTIFDKNTAEILMFEGFFDFLSYLTIEKRMESPLTAIVLNSTNLVSGAKAFIAQNPHISRSYCYFDNDLAGTKLFADLSSTFPLLEMRDLSKTYSPHNDLNEWLLAQ